MTTKKSTTLGKDTKDIKYQTLQDLDLFRGYNKLEDSIDGLKLFTTKLEIMDTKEELYPTEYDYLSKSIKTYSDRDILNVKDFKDLIVNISSIYKYVCTSKRFYELEECYKDNFISSDWTTPIILEHKGLQELVTLDVLKNTLKETADELFNENTRYSKLELNISGALVLKLI